MKQWVSERLHQLKHEGPAGLLAEFRDLQKQHPDEKAITGNLAYLEKRESQMQYPNFKLRAGRLAVASSKVAINWWLKLA